MSFKKNENLELDVIDMTRDGLGLAKIDGQVFFIKDAIVGDRVDAVITKVTSNIVYAKTKKVLKKSSYRVDPRCKVSNQCGGCQLLSLSYDRQLELKKSFVLSCLSNIGKLDIKNAYEGIIPIDDKYAYRNKMQVPFSKVDGDIVYGFYAGRTHHIIEFGNCEVSFNHSDKILEAIKRALLKVDLSIYDEKVGKGIFREVMLRRANNSPDTSVTYIVNDVDYKKNIDKYKRFDDIVINEYNDILKTEGSLYKSSSLVPNLITSTLNINVDNNNVLFGKENVVLRGVGYIKDRIGNIIYQVSPESFYQVNIEMTKKLYDKVIEFGSFDGKDKVLDLYCGIGTISLYVANYVNLVCGIEVVKKAIDNAAENARLNDIKNANFMCMDVKDINSSKLLADGFNTIIVDPPRKGLDKPAIDFIRKASPEKLIYVSCDPATLSRDLNILCNESIATFDDVLYDIKRIVNVDMFPHTMHVETIVLLCRR